MDAKLNNCNGMLKYRFLDFTIVRIASKVVTCPESDHTAVCMSQFIILKMAVFHEAMEEMTQIVFTCL
jgi:hypothetical protein